MKNIIYKVFLIIILTIPFTACAPDEMELNKGMDELKLSVSELASTLDILMADSPALKLIWSSGNNGGTGAAISYILDITKVGNDYSSGISVNMGKSVNEYKITQQELSKMLVKTLGCTPGEEVQIKVRITANVSDDSVDPQQSELIFKVVPFSPVSETLYLIGDATPNGWSANDATALKPVSGSTGLFKWIGVLQKGSFKFITDLGSFMPSYNNAGGNKLNYRIKDSDPDEKFMIEESGKYSLSVDLINLTVSITRVFVKDPPYSNIYFVGSFNNWSFTPMTKDPINPFIFRYGAVLNWSPDGEFKFGTTSGSWGNMYHPTIEKAPYSHTSVILNGSGDNKWAMKESECGVAYKMSLDITPGEEKFVMNKFTPYSGIWMLGDATEASWTIDNAVPMNPGIDVYTFTWTGNLSKGALKFTCDKKSDWNGAWFMAAESDKELLPVTDEVITFVDKSISGNGSIDRKWSIQTIGNYTITINQLTERMTVVKN
jgi:hypothetical protein